jgi:hypothetical protein
MRLASIRAALCVGLGLAAGACNGPTPTASAPAADHHRHPGPAVHGMVLFGQDRLYASHVPMFSAPHDWQALLEVELAHPTLDATALFHALSTDGKQALVTLRPKPFVLPDLLTGQLTSFVATMYRGNFEAGGTVVATDVTVRVKKVVQAAQLSRRTSALAALTYFILPGSTNAAYLAHEITAPDNFDDLVQVVWPGDAPAPTARGPSRLVLDGVADVATQRPPELRTIAVWQDATDASLWRGKSVPHTSPDVVAQVKSAFSCLPGPDFFGACP